MDKKKIAILGGAFDPIHIGHVQVAHLMIKHFDEVWIMPAFDHTFGKKMIDPIHRIAMCNLAFKGSPIKVSDFEIINKPHGTYDLLQKLAVKYPDFDFSIVIGQDNADCIQKWVNWEKLISNHSFVVVPRNGYDRKFHDIWYAENPRHMYLGNLPTACDVVEYSSTKVRAEIASGNNPEYISPEVLKYIKVNKLYGVVK